MASRPDESLPPIELFSIVVPARDEEENVASMVEHLHLELRLNGIPHEIVVVDDGSVDATWEILEKLRAEISAARFAGSDASRSGESWTFRFAHSTPVGFASPHRAEEICT